MNCHNGAEHLREALDSIHLQTFEDWEVIFFDNASTDDSEEIARSYGSKVNYYKNTGDMLSLGAARNEALKYTQGKYIAFLDTDDKWLPDKLKLQVDLLDNNPEVGFTYANVWLKNEDDGTESLANRRTQPEGDVFRRFLRYYPVNLQTVMLRKDILAKLDHWFDPEFEVSEEYDLFMRYLLNTNAAYIDKPVAVYRLHSTMSSIRNIAKYPLENQLVLKKLRTIVPDLDLNYSREVSYFLAKIGYWFASASMNQGNTSAARSYLAPHKYTNGIFFILYMATFMPTVVWEWFQKLRLKVRIS